MKPNEHPTPPAREESERAQEVLKAIREMAFGTIEITVHQSRIVQIVRSEKVRFDQH